MITTFNELDLCKFLWQRVGENLLRKGSREKERKKKSKIVNQHTPGKEFCGKGKENGSIAGGKLREI